MKMWIARDPSGALWLYEKKPQKLQTIFLGGKHNELMELPDDAFPEVLFGNSPQEVELKLIKK